MRCDLTHPITPLPSEYTWGYDTPTPPPLPIAYDFLFVKSRPQNPMCQVIPPPSPLRSPGPDPNAYPHQFRDGPHTVPVPTHTHNLGKPNLTIVARATSLTHQPSHHPPTTYHLTSPPTRHLTSPTSTNQHELATTNNTRPPENCSRETPPIFYYTQINLFTHNHEFINTQSST